MSKKFDKQSITAYIILALLIILVLFVFPIVLGKVTVFILKLFNVFLPVNHTYADWLIGMIWLWLAATINRIKNA